LNRGPTAIAFGAALTAELRARELHFSFVSLLESVPLDHQVCEKAGKLMADARRAGKTVPMGDGLHAAVAELEDLNVATVDVAHFKALGARALNPLK
jgi:predicted nucleic acid-binding protein